MSLGADKSSSSSAAVIAPDLGALRQDLSGNLNAQLAGGQFGPTAAATTFGPAMLLSILTGQPINELIQSGAFQPAGTPFQNIGQEPLPPSAFELTDREGNVIGTFKTQQEARRRAMIESFKNKASKKSSKGPVGQSAIVSSFFGSSE